jgi:hypothetical protein
MDAMEASLLEHLFEERKVLEMVKGINSYKAPDPDGFSDFLPSLLGSD